MSFLGVSGDSYWAQSDGLATLRKAGLEILSEEGADPQSWHEYERAVLAGRLSFANTLPADQAELKRERANDWFGMFERYGRNAMGFAALKEAFAASANAVLGHRLSRWLEWAEACGAVVTSRTQSPVFGVRSRNGDRILSVSADWVYLYMNPAQYPGGESERNRLVSGLQKLDLLSADLDAAEVVSGRNLSRHLSDLTDQEFEELIGILAEFVPTAATV